MIPLMQKVVHVGEEGLRQVQVKGGKGYLQELDRQHSWLWNDARSCSGGQVY
jgi:hypothetical protein